MLDPADGDRDLGVAGLADEADGEVTDSRDYAILLLLVTYGLRAREVAALTLDDIDWRRDRLAIPGRKAGHSTAFPLSAVVGEALVDYLRHGRPSSPDRHVFFRAVAPQRPISRVAVFYDFSASRLLRSPSCFDRLAAVADPGAAHLDSGVLHPDLAPPLITLIDHLTIMVSSATPVLRGGPGA